MKKHSSLFLLFVFLSGILFCIGIIISVHFYQTVKKQEEEKKLYQIYLEHYIKAYGTVERTFSENPPISLTASYAEYRKSIDFTSNSYTSEDWVIYFLLENCSEEPYLLYDAPKQLDYLVDGVWYECNEYGYVELPIAKDPENQPQYFVDPGEDISISIPIRVPIRLPNAEVPVYSGFGRFWYGHYRLVVEYAEGQFTFVEFDLPETAEYLHSCLYPESK